MRWRWIVSVALLGLGLAGSVAYALAKPAKVETSHRLLHLALENGELTVVSSVRVDMPLRERLARPGPDTRYRVALVSEQGRVLFETGINDPFELRGEWPADDGSGRIEGVHLRKTGRVDFSVRVPMAEAARVKVLGVPEGMPRATVYAPRAFVTLGQAALPRVVQP